MTEAAALCLLDDGRDLLHPFGGLLRQIRLQSADLAIQPQAVAALSAQGLSAAQIVAPGGEAGTIFRRHGHYVSLQGDNLLFIIRPTAGRKRWMSRWRPSRRWRLPGWGCGSPQALAPVRRKRFFLKKEATCYFTLQEREGFLPWLG